MQGRGTQKKRVLEYMMRHGFISPFEAFKEIGCLRLGARIWDLRKDGHKINSTRVNYRNAWGEPRHYTVYTLEDEE